MQNIIYEDAGKIMSRGQLVIPIEIRKKAGLIEKTIVRIKLTSEHNIIIEPLEKKKIGLAALLQSMKNDKTIYWTKKDDKRRAKIRKLSMQKIKNIKW